eukprot:c22392_g2_i1 orf=2-871(-)
MLPQPSLEHLALNLCTYSKVSSRFHALYMHAYVCKYGLETHKILGNCLVSMLVDVGSICDAEKTFGKLVYPNSVSWNLLITGYIKCDRLQHALGLFQRMQKHVSLHLTGHNFVALLKACTKHKDLERGLELHGEVARTGMERDVFVGSTLVDMYAKCGSVGIARQVFKTLPVRNVVSWNALIAGYTKSGYGEEALECFDQMQLEGVSPDAVTFLSSLKACGTLGFLEKGQDIHAEIERKNLVLVDAAIGNTLLDMYVKCGSLDIAQQVFDRLPVRDVISWTSLIAGYAEH